MMDKIINDLEDNMKDIYDDDHFTIYKLFHFMVRNYPEVSEIIKKYKGNPKDTENKLFQLLEEEIQQIKPNDTFLVTVFRTGYNQGGRFQQQSSHYVQYQRIQEELQNSLLQQAMILEKERARNNYMDPTQGMTVNEEVSVEAFLLALFTFPVEMEINENDSIVRKIIVYTREAFTKNGFKVNRFQKDFYTNKTGTQSMIKKYCKDLIKMAKDNKLAPVIGRDKEIKKAIKILKKKKKNNPILVGEAGTGKTSIAEGLAQIIVKGEVPSFLKEAEFYSLSMAELVAGAKFRGEFEERLTKLIKEVEEKEAEGKLVIIFIDEIHSLMGTGDSSGSLDAANIIKPALARGTLRTIGATTTDEWNKYLKKDGALDRRFKPIQVNETNKEETLAILEGSQDYFAQYHNVTYSKESIETIYNLASEFMPGCFPDKAIDVMDSSGAIANIKKHKEVSVEIIEKTISENEDIPLEVISQTAEKITNPVSERLEETIFGQSEAIERISKSLEGELAKTRDPNKPIGAYLLAGTTGVGKTETAESIKKIMNAELVHINMETYKESHTVSQLFGAPAGYVGYEDGSILTKALRKNSRLVILLDEIEKAHPDVQDIFLNIIDKGYTTDRQNNKLNFKNTIILMTTNEGSQQMNKKKVGLAVKNDTKINKNEGLKALQAGNKFKPEFLARLSDVIFYNKMDKSLMEKILEKNLKQFNQYAMKPKGLKMKLSQAMKDEIIERSYREDLGARPLGKHFDHLIKQKLNKEILYKSLKGVTNKTVTADYENGKVKLKVS